MPDVLVTIDNLLEIFILFLESIIGIVKVNSTARRQCLFLLDFPYLAYMTTISISSALIFCVICDASSASIEPRPSVTRTIFRLYFSFLQCFVIICMAMTIADIANSISRQSRESQEYLSTIAIVCIAHVNFLA